MSQTQPAPARSLGGGLLPGTCIVRTVYLDEAGISNQSQEPHIVVAAAITNPDQVWHKILRYYHDLASDVFDGRIPWEFVFHATDVWHGAGFFPRKEWALSDRMKLMKRLAQVPALFDVPICLGIVNKEYADNNSPSIAPSDNRTLRAYMHAMAFHYALQGVDWWMTKNRPGEVANAIAEDTQEVKETLKLFHAGAQSGSGWFGEDVFTTRTIVDALSFAPKTGSPLLQIADTCAFLARRVAMRCQFARPHFREFQGQIVRPTGPMRNVGLVLSASSLRTAS